MAISIPVGVMAAVGVTAKPRSRRGRDGADCPADDRSDRTTDDRAGDDAGARADRLRRRGAGGQSQATKSDKGNFVHPAILLPKNGDEGTQKCDVCSAFALFSPNFFFTEEPGEWKKRLAGSRIPHADELEAQRPQPPSGGGVVSLGVGALFPEAGEIESAPTFELG